MDFGYPGANTHIENHGVSEESFWPSFTDIMMVIVMVFLLVTVSVILNNWSLITDLQNSIKAQKLASSLAENRQEKNHTLESQLIALKQRITQLSAESKNKTTRINSVKKALADSNKQLQEKASSFSLLEEKLAQKLNELLLAQKTFDESNKQKDQKIKELESTSTTRASLLASLKTDSSKTQEALKLLQANYDKAQEALKAKIAATQKVQSVLSLLRQTSSAQAEELASLKNSLKKEEDEKQRIIIVMNERLEESQLSAKEKAEKLAILQNELKKKEDEKQDIIIVMNKKLTDAQEKIAPLELSITQFATQLTERTQEVVALREKEQQRNSLLSSLQGDFDALDVKYQKLLRPARSSKGKFVVTVSYKKRDDLPLIRIKTSPTASYQTVDEVELTDLLTALKAEHKSNLYLKIIIPENSGLSYSEAWKFTNNLQKKYDYYHSP